MNGHGCFGNSLTLCCYNMSRDQSLCCMQTLSHWGMYSSELLCYGGLCVSEAFAVVNLWVFGVICVAEEFAMMGV